MLEDDSVTIVVQINGKVRASFICPRDSNEADVKTLAHSLDEVQKWLEEKEVVKEIYVPNKLFSIALK